MNSAHYIAELEQELVLRNKTNLRLIEEATAANKRIVELEHDLIMSRDHAKHLREQCKDAAQWKEEAEANAKEACEYENALVGWDWLTSKGEFINKHKQCMERIRDLIAMEGELGDLKETLKRSKP